MKTKKFIIHRHIPAIGTSAGDEYTTHEPLLLVTQRQIYTVNSITNIPLTFLSKLSSTRMQPLQLELDLEFHVEREVLKVP